VQITLGRDEFPHRQDRYRCVTRRQLNRYAMSWWQQAPRPIQCRSCTGSVPLRCVLRPSRLPERNRHAGDLWRPNACLMTKWGQGEPDSLRILRSKGVLAIVLARDRSLGAIECERACTASRATTGAQLGSGCACEPPQIGAAHSYIDTEQLASAAPSHSTSADKHPRTPTGGREAGAEGSMGRKGALGGREYEAEGSMGRKRGWGGREHWAGGSLPQAEHGADGSMGRKGAWGGREYKRKGGWGGREHGAEGSLGRTGVWGGRDSEHGTEGSIRRKGGWGGREHGVEGSMGRKGAWGGREYGAEGRAVGTSKYFKLQDY
jgi:hypothetical protein